MTRVTFIDCDGREYHVPASIGGSLMEAARSSNVPGILADCGGCCACGTCHVVVEPEWRECLSAISEEEEMMLEFGVERRSAGSRLSCQIRITEALDGLVLRLPAAQK